MKRVQEINRVAVWISGGDSPGMNAVIRTAIRAIVRNGIGEGTEVLGVDEVSRV